MLALVGELAGGGPHHRDGHPRDGVRPRGRRPRVLPRRRRAPGVRAARAGARRARRGPRTRQFLARVIAAGTAAADAAAVAAPAAHASTAARIVDAGSAAPARRHPGGAVGAAVELVAQLPADDLARVDDVQGVHLALGGPSRLLVPHRRVDRQQRAEPDDVEPGLLARPRARRRPRGVRRGRCPPPGRVHARSAEADQQQLVGPFAQHVRPDPGPPIGFHERHPSGAPRRTFSSSAAALRGEHPADHLGAVGEPAVTQHVPQRAGRAGLRLPRPEHHARHPGQPDRAGAHRAGLDGHRERAALQPPLPPHGGGGAQGEHLGVRGGVAERLAGVARRRPARARRRRRRRRRSGRHPVRGRRAATSRARRTSASSAAGRVNARRRPRRARRRTRSGGRSRPAARRVELQLAGEHLELVGGQAQVGEDRRGHPRATGRRARRRRAAAPRAAGRARRRRRRSRGRPRRRTASARPRRAPGRSEDEELVVDVEQAEHGTGRRAARAAR